jgi:hypothetical protein
MVDTERPHLTAQNLTHQIADKLATLYDSMSVSENSIFKMPRLKPKHVNLGAGTSQELQTGDQWGLGIIHINRRCTSTRVVFFAERLIRVKVSGRISVRLSPHRAGKATSADSFRLAGFPDS